jgi:hypothetical protein
VKKATLLSTFLTAIIVSGLILVSAARFSTAQDSTNVSGIISSDTTWTKANSPYSLTGPVAVNAGVTLTIEAGVTVEGGYYIQINGTLRARGSNAIPINYDGEIRFMSPSSNWNEQTGSGSVIENMFVTLVTVNNASPKIEKSHLKEIITQAGSPIISNNNIDNNQSYMPEGFSGYATAGIDINGGGAPVIFNNYISGIIINGASPVIKNNTITRGSNSDLSVITIYGGSPVISNNTIYSGTYTWEGVGIFPGGSKVFPGITGTSNNAVISDNVISGCSLGVIIGGGTVERNLIFNNTGVGLEIGQGTIRYNTIVNNTMGIKLKNSPSATINYNNFQNYGQYSVYLEDTANDVAATDNWWGTTDTSAINQSIYDNKRDFNLGTVNFLPFLTAPNIDAPPIPPSTSLSNQSLTPSPSPSPSQPPTSTPNILEPYLTIIVVVTVVAVVAAGAGLLVYFKKPRS